MKLIRILFLVLLIATQSVFSQSSEKVLAKVGNKRITEREFKERFELVPQLNRTQKNIEEKKKELLYTIIAEKLFSLEAQALHYDTTEIMKHTYKALEEMYVRDALYTEKIKSKVSVRKEDLIKGKNRYGTSLVVNYIYSQDQNEINSIYQQLITGANFNSILQSRPEYHDEQNPYTVVYGKMQEYVEDLLYKLKVGEYTAPVESPNGYYIFKLVRKVNRTIPSGKNAEGIQKNVYEIAKERAEDRVYQKFYSHFFGNKKVVTNGELFWNVADKISKIILDNKIVNNIRDGEKIIFDENNLIELEKQIGSDTLSMTFMKINDKLVTLKKFLREFIFEGFYTNSTDPNVISAQLNSRVKRFIEMQFLADQAYSEGLENLPEVKHFTEMWKDNYLAQLYKNSLLQTVNVNDHDALKYYNSKQKNFTPVIQVNILEILTDSLDVIDEVLKELDKGTDFRKLARIHTKRKWTREKGGEFGYFPITMYGDIGKVAGELEVGEIYGPLKVENGYSIFKLIGKKKPDEQKNKSFDEIKNEIKSQLKFEKLKNKLINKTAQLAIKYGVSINNKLLNNLKVKNINMLVYKYMGFGGRILAFPITPPFYQWSNKWKEIKNNLP